MSDVFKATKPADYYIEPSPDEMQSLLRRVGLGELQDIETGLAANNAASFTLRDGKVSDSFTNPEATSDPLKAATLQNLLQEVNFSNLSGNNPTTKAAAFAAAVNSQPGGLNGIVNDVKNGRSIQQIADQINQKIAGVQRALQNEFARQQLGMPPDLPEAILPKLGVEETALLEAMGHVAKLGFIKSNLRTSPTQDDAGNIIRPDEMMDFDQLPLLWSPEIVADPLFDFSFLNMELDIEQSFKTHQVKQVIDLLIDRSYSMYEPWKQGFVKAILLHYMELVRLGTTTLYVSTFERSADGHTRIETLKEAEDYYKSYRCEGGGGTDVNNVILNDQQSIAHNKLGRYKFHIDSQPQVVVINDGQDRVDPSMKTLAPVFAVTLEERNMGLKELCNRSGGEYHEFASPNSKF